jgi:hypothetical protein
LSYKAQSSGLKNLLPSIFAIAYPPIVKLAFLDFFLRNDYWDAVYESLERRNKGFESYE